MATAGVRVGVFGATGAVGSALIEALGASSIRIADLLAVAGDRSVGEDIDFAGDLVSVTLAIEHWPGLDAVFLCAPPDASREAGRQALRAEVPVIDLSGAFAAVDEVPLGIAALREASASPVPLLAAPTGPALACSLVLEPLARAAGLERVHVTVIDSAAVGGQRGSERLAHESLALFNQQDPADSDVFPRPVAFDCGPGGESAREREQQAVQVLRRTLGEGVAVAVTALQVPTFVGLGASLRVEFSRDLSAEDAGAALVAAAGVELWSEPHAGPSLRSAAGREEVLVGPLRQEGPRSLTLWLACDGPCLAAKNAVQLAEPQLQRPG